MKATVPHLRRSIEKAHKKLTKARKIFDKWLLNETVDLAEHIWLVDEAMQLMEQGYHGKALKVKPNPEKKKWKNMKTISILDIPKHDSEFKG